jgi:hypothetical protein
VAIHLKTVPAGRLERLFEQQKALNFGVKDVRVSVVDDLFVTHLEEHVWLGDEGVVGCLCDD